MNFVVRTACWLGIWSVVGLTTAFAQAPPGAPVSAVPAPFFGGVPTGTVVAEPLALTILDAIDRALGHNLGLLHAEENVNRARGARWAALADLLPNASGHVAETRQKVNLAAFGFPLPEGIPAVVGPFNVFDARVFVSQAVLDRQALNQSRAAQHTLLAAQHNVRSARDLVVLVTANLYLQALAAAARTESAAAQVASAEAILSQASDMKASGLVAGIEVLRAEVQLDTERQRATASRNGLEKTKLQLARVIGLPIGQAFTLVSELPYVPAPEITIDEAWSRAKANRPDYQAALEHLRAAEATRSAASGEWLPSVHVDANYGRLGLTPADAATTYSILGEVRVPIFNGGRTRSRVIEADTELRQRRAEVEDLEAALYYDVKTAFLDLDATSAQLQVATRSRDLAAQQLTQARDRFAAGVTTSIEIVQAQEAVALSSEQDIAALYGFNMAKAMLARGLGVAEDATRQYLGGTR